MSLAITHSVMNLDYEFTISFVGTVGEPYDEFITCWSIYIGNCQDSPKLRQISFCAVYG